MAHLEHEGQHVFRIDESLAQQAWDLKLCKFVKTSREKLIEKEVTPVERNGWSDSLILDEIVSKENIQIDNEALDAGTQPINGSQQGVDFPNARRQKRARNNE